MKLSSLVNGLPFVSLNEHLKNYEKTGSGKFLFGVALHSIYALGFATYIGASIFTRTLNPLDWSENFQENIEQYIELFYEKDTLSPGNIIPLEYRT